MKLSDFDYILPPELIAQTPVEPRDSSRLLVFSRQSGQIQDNIFCDIEEFLGENDVLVLNQTRVLKARLKGRLESGKECEVFLHKQIQDNIWDCLVYPGKKLKPGLTVDFYSDVGEKVMQGEIQSISEK
jgi:S-adenosylmethionine:tRNA ribosyltransferase-isomerase